MIKFQDRAASDDAAAMAAQYAKNHTPDEPIPQISDAAAVRQSMADLFCENDERELPTTDHDLWINGFTDDEIAAHLPAAKKIARQRIGAER